jgi:NADH-ubiquinone oxidoreductase chain 1
MIIEILLSLLDVLLVLIPVLISVAIITIVERKVLAYTQRRIGPNIVGYYGILQPFADALKLILKENLIPQHVNKILFFISPCISLIAAFLG